MCRGSCATSRGRTRGSRHGRRETRNDSPRHRQPAAVRRLSLGLAIARLSAFVAVRSTRNDPGHPGADRLPFRDLDRADRPPRADRRAAPSLTIRRIMLDGKIVLFASFAYLALLFGVAFYGDRRAAEGRSLIGNPYIYSLSLGVYATAFSFYGGVGRAASTGVGIVAISLGPTLFAALGWMLLRKMIRISKTNRITSIAD